MTSNLKLEDTIDKILNRTEKDIVSNLRSALDDSRKNLDDFVPKLEGQYDKIIADGKKEAEKLEKQIIGSSDLEARNKQLLTLEDAVDKVFSNALDQIAKTARSGDYLVLIETLLAESINVLGTSKVTVFTNKSDKDAVKSVLSKFKDATLSTEPVDCIGGVMVKSKDGTMKFDNTLDARIQRMKPLIRKEIASKFGVGN